MQLWKVTVTAPEVSTGIHFFGESSSSLGGLYLLILDRLALGRTHVLLET